jgi:hypothetical protein
MSDSQRSMEEDRADREVSRLNAEVSRYREHAIGLTAENNALRKYLLQCIECFDSAKYGRDADKFIKEARLVCK